MWGGGAFLRTGKLHAKFDKTKFRFEMIRKWPRTFSAVPVDFRKVAAADLIKWRNFERRKLFTYDTRRHIFAKQND